MAEKPLTADGYRPEYLSLVRSTCLYLATKLGDLMDDLVIVGGLVPSLLISQDDRSAETRHVGTMDLDIGLALALLDESRYTEMALRLRRAGFSPDVNEKGNPTSQRWTMADAKVTVDFLIQPTLPSDKPARLRNLEKDFAAIIIPGMQLAFRDREQVRLTGQTIQGESATRNVWVCGPAAFTVLKALAIRYRGENKDAYDLYYLLQNYGQGIGDVSSRIRTLLDDSDTRTALQFLREDFDSIDAVGPTRVAIFLRNLPDEALQADAHGAISALLQQLDLP